MADIRLGDRAASLSVVCQRGGSAVWRWAGTLTDTDGIEVAPESLRWAIVVDMFGGEVVLRGVTFPDGSVEWSVPSELTSEWPRGSYSARLIVHEAPVGEPAVIAIGAVRVEDI